MIKIIFSVLLTISLVTAESLRYMSYRVATDSLNKELSLNKDYRKLSVQSKYYVIQFYKDFSTKQQQTIANAYNYGTAFDLKYTLAAIAWKESLGGLVKVNLWDGRHGSCGVFMNNLDTVASDIKGFKYTRFEYNKLCTNLIDNFEYSLMEAIKVVRHFQSKCKSNWQCIWAHYNGGYAHPNYNYAKDIYYRIQAIKFIFEKNN